MPKCKHIAIEMPDTIRGFTGSVATAGRTHDNPPAHGGIWMLQECQRCGWRRQVNSNGCHEEFSGWWDHPGEVRRAAEARQRREDEAEEARRRLEQEAEDPEIRKAAQACVAAYAGRISWAQSISISTEAHEAGGFVALLQDDGCTDCVVIGRGPHRIAALLSAAQNADKIVDALGHRDQHAGNLSPQP